MSVAELESRMSDFINDVPDMSSLSQGETKGLMENTEALWSSSSNMTICRNVYAIYIIVKKLIFQISTKRTVKSWQLTKVTKMMKF